MPIDKINGSRVQGNIIHYNFNSKPTQEKEEIKTPLQTQPAEPGRIIPLQLISAYNGNIIVNDKISQMRKFLEERDVENIDDDKIRESIQDFYKNAPHFKLVRDKALQFCEEVTQDINDCDFSKLQRIQSIFGYDIKDENQAILCDFYGIDPEEYVESKESLDTITNISKLYGNKIKEKGYKVTYYYSQEEDNGMVCKQIQLEKNGYIISFMPMAFLNTVQKGKICGDSLVVLPSNKDDEFMYSYTTKKGYIQKTDKKDTIVEMMTQEDFDKKGNPVFNLASDFSHGIAYGYKIKNMETDEDILFEESKDLSQEFAIVYEMAKNDPVVAQYLQDYFSPSFIVKCVRDGQFCQEVADAREYFYDYIDERTEECVEESFVDNILTTLENEDNTFDYDLLDTMLPLIMKHIKSPEDYRDLTLEIAYFLKENPTKENLKVITKIATSDFLTLDESEKLFVILQKFNAGDYKSAKKSLNNLIAANLFQFGAMKLSSEVFSDFFEDFLK